MIPSIGPVQARLLLDHYEAHEIFRLKQGTLEKMEGIGTSRATQVISFRDFARAEKELRFIEQYRIRTLYIRDEAYPQRLLNCYDAPILLYMKGDTDLNHPKTVSVIGTRNNTAYGKLVTEKLIADLKELDIVVISGLAFGIDALAHRAALKNGLCTVGVLGHGLDQVYPSLHQPLAREMLASGGGLLTEYTSRTKPERFNFPMRNRIVAGMSDCVVVSETGLKGGSMITAELANGYNREVVVFPGRVNDHKSAGCNRLIRQNKAMLIQEAGDLVELMNWGTGEKRITMAQPQLFHELNPDETLVLDTVTMHGSMPIDLLYAKTGLNAGRIASAILNLELKNLLLSLPGKIYRAN